MRSSKENISGKKWGSFNFGELLIPNTKQTDGHQMNNCIYISY